MVGAKQDGNGYLPIEYTYENEQFCIVSRHCFDIGMIGYKESNTLYKGDGYAEQNQERSVSKNVQLVAEPGPNRAWLPLLVLFMYFFIHQQHCEIHYISEDIVTKIQLELMSLLSTLRKLAQLGYHLCSLARNFIEYLCLLLWDCTALHLWELCGSSWTLPLVLGMFFVSLFIFVSSGRLLAAEPDDFALIVVFAWLGFLVTRFFEARSFCEVASRNFSSTISRVIMFLLNLKILALFLCFSCVFGSFGSRVSSVMLGQEARSPRKTFLRLLVESLCSC